MIQEGFAFTFDPASCTLCDGFCCCGESGYIWLSKKEIEHIAAFKNMTITGFLSTFCIKEGYKYSLKEQDAEELGVACIFFDLESKRCQIYEVRPKQCRDFPFWESFKQQTQEVLKECPYVKPL